MRHITWSSFKNDFKTDINFKDWTLASQGTIHASNYVDNDTQTDLSIGTHDDDELQVLSSDGTDVTLPLATSAGGTNLAGLLSPTQVDNITANNAKVTNATHTGQVTGSGVLTVDVTAISDQSLVSAASGDHILIRDATDASLKKVDALDFLSGADDDIDSISIVNDSLYIGEGATILRINLDQFLDDTDTDDQGFDVAQLNGTVLELSLDDDGEATQEIELSSLLDDTDIDSISLVNDSLYIGENGTILRINLDQFLDDTDTQLSEEQVEDFVGGMLGGTQTLITVTYQDGTNDIDFEVEPALSNYTNDAGFITATLTQEQVEDYAGGLFNDGTGTYTGISITYQDGTDDVDITIDHDAAANFVANEHIDWTGASAGTIHATNYVDNDTDVDSVSLVNDSLYIRENGTFFRLNLDGFLDNTDAQTLGWSSPNLSITGGNSVDLSSLLDDTDTHIDVEEENANVDSDVSALDFQIGFDIMTDGTESDVYLNLGEFTQIDSVTTDHFYIVYDSTQTTNTGRKVSKEDWLRMPNRWTGKQGFAQATLTDQATVTWDWETEQTAKVTLSDDRTLANPTNVQAGDQATLVIIQSSSGGPHTLTWGSNYLFSGGDPVLSTGANDIDVMTCHALSATQLICTMAFNFE